MKCLAYCAVVLLAIGVAAATGTTTPSTTPPTTPPVPIPTQSDLPDKPPTVRFNLNVSGTVCVMLQLGGRFEIEYETRSGSEKVKRQYDMPNISSSIDGNCNITSPRGQLQRMAVHFEQQWLNSFYVHFRRSATNRYVLDEYGVSFKADEAFFPDIKHPGVEVTMVKKEANLFEAPDDSSFRCISDAELTFDAEHSDANVTTAEVHVRDWWSQAFRTSTSTRFGSVKECDADFKTNQIVPIAVGAALAVLIIIVLIAYLVGRQKTKRGYESV